jgi:hypothetical protein
MKVSGSSHFFQQFSRPNPKHAKLDHCNWFIKLVVQKVDMFLQYTNVIYLKHLAVCLYVLANCL